METRDEKFRFRINGRFQHDWAWMDQDEAMSERFGKLEDKTEVRRARIELSGNLYRRVEVAFQLDFADGNAQARDVYIGVSGLPILGRLRAGHFKEPFSLEELTSSKYITFMERSSGNVFVPSRNIGIAFNNTLFHERMTWSAGFFARSEGFDSLELDEGFAATARVTGLPWYKEDGKRLLHVGVGLSHRDTVSNQIRFRQRPEAHLPPRLVDTGVFPAQAENLIASELALVNGPLYVQSEWTADMVSRPGSNPRFSSFYIEGGCFLTGEYRRYNRDDATFTRVRPTKNFFGGGGKGAWQIAVRFSIVDLNDRSVSGGRLDDLTIGLNWHLNPYAKILWNYIRTYRDEIGNASIFQVRFHIDF
ncbi:MAG: porin [Deltaproteobacteria bacterium]|nr:porin [Deltaproteobacteria bacterium]